MTSPCIWSHRLQSLPIISLSNLRLPHKAHLLIFITSGLPHMGNLSLDLGLGLPGSSVRLKYRQASCLYMNILFICNQGKNRSKTAAKLFSRRFQTASAGLYSDKPVTQSQLSQAHVIIVMEEKHRREIAKRFPLIYMQKQILVLDIPDIYRYKQLALVQLLKSRVSKLL
jgi:predicted protein tyrosine phosphatase